MKSDDQLFEICNDINELGLSVYDGLKTGGELLNSRFALFNEVSERADLVVKFINSLIVSHDVGSFLASKFVQKLTNKVDNLIERCLVDFGSGGSELREDSNHWGDERRRLV